MKLTVGNIWYVSIVLSQMAQCGTTVAHPVKLVFFANKEFLCFSLLSLVILVSKFFHYVYQALKLRSEDRIAVTVISATDKI